MKGALLTIAGFVAATVLTFIGIVILFYIGAWPQIAILFYRGILFCVISVLTVFVVALIISRTCHIWHVRDLVSAACFAASINMCFFVVVPVTTDRSISVFILNELAASPDTALTPQEIRDRFVRTYVDGYDQIARRLEEQRASGNIAKSGAGYRITNQGVDFIRFARALAGIFHTDPRFIDMRSHAAAAGAVGGAQ